MSHQSVLWKSIIESIMIHICYELRAEAMFFQKQPPIHQAILNHDLEYLQKNSSERTCNSWGYSPDEMARFLNQKESLEILNPSVPREFKVLLKNESKIKLIDEEVFFQIFHLHYCPTCLFPGYTTFKRVMGSCSRLFITGDRGEENRELGAEYREKLMQGWFGSVSIRWIDEVLEYGLFAEEDFPKGSYVGEYTGMIRQINRMSPDLNGYCIRYPTVWPIFRYYVIDAFLFGNELRFVNHSSRPNLEPKVLVDRSFLHTVYFAARDVKKGEQLTFNYGADYWRRRGKPILIE